MINLSKTVGSAVKDGAVLYAADKAVDTVGQLAVNFMPAAVPVAASVAVGGLALSVAVKSLGKGKLVQEFGDFCAALAISQALSNIAQIEGPVTSLTNKIKVIGMDPLAAAALTASSTTQGYLRPRNTAGYLSTRGYVPAMAGARMGSRGSSMRGLTTIHGF